MLEFIKMFGLGVLYTILSPVILLFFLVFVVYSFFNYLVCEVINLSGFFFGRKFTAHTELDKRLSRMKKEKEEQSREGSVDVSVNQHVIDVESRDGDLHA